MIKDLRYSQDESKTVRSCARIITVLPEDVILPAVTGSFGGCSGGKNLMKVQQSLLADSTCVCRNIRMWDLRWYSKQPVPLTKAQW